MLCFKKFSLLDLGWFYLVLMPQFLFWMYAMELRSCTMTGLVICVLSFNGVLILFRKIRLAPEVREMLSTAKGKIICAVWMAIMIFLIGGIFMWREGYDPFFTKVYVATYWCCTLSLLWPISKSEQIGEGWRLLRKVLLISRY